MRRLEGKVAIITGSTEGIGEATAHKFALEGATGVLVVGRNEKRAGQVADAICKAGGNAYPCKTDISQPADVENMVNVAIKQFGKLNILLNNAAKTSNHDDFAAVDAELDAWQKAFDVNVTGALLCAKHAIPAMIDAGGGSIVNSASGLGKLADSRWPGYSCSKAALMRLSQHIAVTYGSKGIRSNVIIIGLVETAAQEGMIPDAMREILARNHLVGRLGRPDEIANVLAFIASDEASFITGAEISADGGYLSHLPHMVQVEDLVMSMAA